ELAFLDTLAAVDGLVARKAALDERLSRFAHEGEWWPTVARLSGPGLEERADDADAVGHDVLVTRHGAARQVRGRELRAERGGDRVSPRDPFKLCGVHGSSTSWVP